MDRGKASKTGCAAAAENSAFNRVVLPHLATIPDQPISVEIVCKQS
jgi:hypothetical protein